MTGNGQVGPVAVAQPAAAETSMREVMSRFATGITVLTVGGDNSHGMTANAFSSVSIDPPLVLCCVAHNAVMHEAITTARYFAVSMLSADQENVARYFANWRRPPGPAQFDEVSWRPGPHTGAPLLTDSLAWLECELTKLYEGGDHSIFLGKVLGLSLGSSGQALLFFDGDYQVVPDAP